MNTFMTAITSVRGFNPMQVANLSNTSALSAAGNVDVFQQGSPAGTPVSMHQAAISPTARPQISPVSMKPVAGERSRSKWSAMDAPLLGLSVMMSAGFKESEVEAFFNTPAGEMAIVSVFILALLPVFYFYAKRRVNGALAQQYYGDEFTQALGEIKTCKRTDRGWKKDDVKLLRGAASAASRTMGLEPDKREAAIDRLFDRWENNAGISYSAKIPSGIPARALLTIAEQMPEAFTAKQYERMANVGADGFVPSCGTYIKRAAELLKPRFTA